MDGCLHLLPQNRPELLDALLARCPVLNDPQRAAQILAYPHCERRVYVAAPGHDTLPGTHPAYDNSTYEEQLLQAARWCQVVVVYSLSPGRSSYSVFVQVREAEGGGARGAAGGALQLEGTCEEAQATGLPYALDALRTEADVQIVNRHWMYRSPYSLPLVRLLVAHRHTVCARLQPSSVAALSGSPSIFDATGAPSPQLLAAADCPGSLEGHEEGGAGGAAEAGSRGGEGSAVAWILQYGDGSIGMVHTLEAHRRCGLMRACVLEMLRRLQADLEQRVSGGCSGAGRAGQQTDAYVFIVPDNTSSVKLFEGLGFRPSSEPFHWFGVESSS
ncbi:hypothetical protein TSOC_008477 [Tetrabaena socialis]|uniref:GCN5-related N-acetyltransferase Rv2170-like domain-containing protein n=1 Tax=Tetrabaena socialis TaxID=47790 RepID=A0A2J7ZYE9_9CHLO|nr:hypothetical protein TSOC_008477 [Tetrabaena socialis]|eukprot:PNH05288.1 hypothetical protein TSOC_008477 [Tetrabaena socialis]